MDDYHKMDILHADQAFLAQEHLWWKAKLILANNFLNWALNINLSNNHKKIFVKKMSLLHATINRKKIQEC